MDSDMLLFLSCVYVLVACLFLAETYFEGERAQAPWDLWRILGLAAGLVWPIYLCFVFGILFVQDRSTKTPSATTSPTPNG